MSFSIQLITAFLLDLVVGDPRWLYHPVRIIGWWCSALENISRSRLRSLGLREKGVFVTIAVTGAVLMSLITILYLSWKITPYLGLGLAFFFLYTGIAAGDLFRHSRKVARCLESGNLEDARLAVAMIVGRDTEGIDESEISRACVESVSENLVDGITAPVFWGVVAAVSSLFLQVDTLSAACCGVYLYKSVNTMDSMIGYRNEAYVDFGRFAARTDDFFNFLPARITGIIVIIAAGLAKMNMRGSWKTFREDRLKSSSPNSGHTEAAVAGALEIQLGGSSSYFGKIYTKPFIGAGLRKPDFMDIFRTNRLVLVTSVFFIFFSLLFFNLFRLALS